MKLTKTYLMQLIKEEIENTLLETPSEAIAEQKNEYDARSELMAIYSLVNKASKLMEALQSKVFNKGYSNEQAILDVAGEVYALPRIIKGAIEGK